ncbi:HNH endonuclease [Aureimonas ureilytica]|uniref:HNH endonuclease n=1 Tax=Aureimonas ureilytica TaxID=401562 RepID=UPI000367ECCD|nr:HNH endonuclease [Aureimonas ureilytica]
MARLTRKTDLLFRFEEAIRSSGWNLLYLTQGAHPARYRIYRDGRSMTTKVYIWNISHGGGTRSESEYRIQVTGIDHFEPEPEGRTLVLGWWEDVGVFAGWDVRQHLGTLGSSPSMQVEESALRQALLTGFAPYVKSNGETAIAFRPDFAGTYVEHLKALHDSGTVHEEAQLLAKLSKDPDDVDDQDIQDDVAAPRQYAVQETRRALRALDFSSRVLSAYGHRCAMCGIQLRLIDGAHILPVAHADSTDQTSNGIALCALHHRAYDRSLIAFDEKFKIHFNMERFKILKDADRIEGFEAFRDSLPQYIDIPPNGRDHPDPNYINKANRIRGWYL